MNPWSVLTSRNAQRVLLYSVAALFLLCLALSSPPKPWLLVTDAFLPLTRALVMTAQALQCAPSLRLRRSIT